MSEEINNEEVLPATLAEGETVIPEDKVEEIKEAIEEVSKTEKVEEAVVASDVISAPEPAGVPTQPGIGIVGDGAMGSTTVPVPPKPKAAKKPAAVKEDTVAIHSTRNVTWSGVGKVYSGFNIVTQEQADKWLTRNHVRVATPQEVAQGFGK
jgi:hypothetical protein